MAWWMKAVPFLCGRGIPDPSLPGRAPLGMNGGAFPPRILLSLPPPVRFSKLMVIVEEICQRRASHGQTLTSNQEAHLRQQYPKSKLSSIREEHGDLKQ